MLGIVGKGTRRPPLSEMSARIRPTHHTRKIHTMTTHHTDATLDQGLVVFLDTETTGLRDEDDVWEIAAILRAENGTEQTFHTFVEHSAEKAARLPPRYLDDLTARYDPTRALPAGKAAEEFTAFVTSQGQPHLVGAVPSFDENIMRSPFAQAHVSNMPWDHHLICIEAVAIGWLYGRGQRVPLPWRSDSLAVATGLPMTNPDGSPRYRRHTAMDDALWVRDWFTHLTASRGPAGR